MVEAKHPQLSVRRQCELLAVNRNRLTPTAPEGLQVEDLELARKVDEINLRFPEFGARRMSHYVNLEGFKSTRRGMARVMQLMGLDSHRLDIPGRKRLEIDHGKPIAAIIA